jgi:hypothetical protein
MEKHRDVVKMAELRWPVYLFQPVEVQRQGVIFEGAIENVLRPLLQAGGR